MAKDSRNYQSINGMTLQQFEYLLAICEHGNMLRASKKLGVTQPTLSIMLRKLEAELDIDIFDRSTQPLRLTEAGKQVVKQAKDILKAAETLRQTVAEQRNLLTGRLKIGVIPTVAPYFVPRFLQHFLDNPRHTDLETSLSEMKTEDIIPALLENEIDMAVMATPLDQERLLEIPIYYEKFHAYVSEKTPSLHQKPRITPQDLVSERLWVLSEGHCLRNQVMNYLCFGEQNTERTYQGGSFTTLIKTIDAVGGCSIVPESLSDDLNEQQRNNIRPLCEPEATREISLVIKDDFAREKLLNEIVETIKQFLPSHMIDERLKRFRVRL